MLLYDKADWNSNAWICWCYVFNWRKSVANVVVCWNSLISVLGIDDCNGVVGYIDKCLSMNLESTYCIIFFDLQCFVNLPTLPLCRSDGFQLEVSTIKVVIH